MTEEKCNHILGWIDGCDETILLDNTNWDEYTYLKDWRHMYKYCPNCGTEIMLLYVMKGSVGE